MCNASNPIGYCKPDGKRRHHNVTHCVTNQEHHFENSALLQHLIMCPVNSEFKINLVSEKTFFKAVSWIFSSFETRAWSKSLASSMTPLKMSININIRTFYSPDVVGVRVKKHIWKWKEKVENKPDFYHLHLWCLWEALNNRNEKISQHQHHCQVNCQSWLKEVRWKIVSDVSNYV